MTDWQFALLTGLYILTGISALISAYYFGRASAFRDVQRIWHEVSE